MAAPQSVEASEIRRRGRQRLIGAVAIALLLIVFVPMLLDSEPRTKKDEPKLDIPPRENAPALPPPVGAPAEPKAAAPAPATDEARKPAPKVAVVEPRNDAKAAPTPAKPAPAPAAPKMEGFAIQVGAFREEAKLQQVRERLAAAKLKTYTEPSGDLTRLRVGPFTTRDEADKAAAVVRKSVPEAKIVTLP
jgi:DedD protein